MFLYNLLRSFRVREVVHLREVVRSWESPLREVLLYISLQSILKDMLWILTVEGC